VRAATNTRNSGPDADAVSVVLWVKEQTDGAAQVQVEL